MRAFAYTAKTRDGQTIEAQVEANTRLEALSVLRSQGVTILDLASQESRSVEANPRPVVEMPSLRFKHPAVRRLPLGVLTAFCRQLAISMKVGVPLRDALNSIEEDEEHVGMRRHLRAIIAQLDNGVSFSGALEGQGRAFGTLFVCLIRAAEESGNMDEALSRLADYLEKADQLRRKIRSLIAYPMFVGGFFVLVCAIMTVMVLPRFQSIFSGFSAELPLITRVVFGANAWVLDHGLWLSVLVIGLWLMLASMGRLSGGQLLVDQAKLKIPILGECWRKIAVSRFCRNMAIMTKGGVPIATGIELAAGVCGNLALENAFRRTAVRIVNGSEVSSGMRQEQAIPRLLIRMLGVGEESGQVPQVLDNVANTYEKQVEGMIVMTMAILEPVSICFFGALILIMVLAIYVPIFTVSTHV